MSQWVEEFNNHDFHVNWSDLKIVLENVELDKSASSEEKENLARLKKVVKFIDGILENIDPDLFPKDLLDNLNGYANSCISQIQTFNSNRNITYLNDSHLYIDNILKEIKPYIFYGAKLKRSLRAAISSYIGEIDKHLENIANTQSEYDKAKEYREEIEEYHNALFEDEEEESIKTKIATMLETAESQSESLDGIYTNILVDDDKKSTKTVIEEAKKDILRDAKETNEKRVEVLNKIEELDKFHTKIFGEYDEEKEARVGGLDKILNQLKVDLEVHMKDQKNKHQKLHEKIESLLPGATSAGLAKAYQEVKARFYLQVQLFKFSLKDFIWGFKS